MNKTSKDRSEMNQVELFKLIFTLNWEDPRSDQNAMKIKAKDTLMTITSGGCNTLSFLLDDPSKIFSLDINPCQSYLLELKIAAMSEFDREGCLQFFGIMEGTERLSQYQEIRSKLSSEAAQYWDSMNKVIQSGFIMKGRYEKFVKLVGKFIKLFMGSKRINGLFLVKDLQEQKEFYEKYWNNRRTRSIFKIFFNKYMLARKGLKADYFHFDDGSKSFAESFFNRFQKILRDLTIDDNYFIHLYLKGQYRSYQELPDYLKDGNYEIVKKRLERIEIITGDAKVWLSGAEAYSIDCFSLSNICELMSPEDTHRTFSEVIRTARKDGRICFRNLMVPREVPEDLRPIIIKDEVLSKTLMDFDRSFVYGKNAAYTITKSI